MTRREIPWDNEDYFDLFGKPISSRRSPPTDSERSLEEFVQQLDPELQELYFLRFGERLSLRRIAFRLGFKSHWPVQTRLEEIKRAAKEWLDGHNKVS